MTAFNPKNIAKQCFKLVVIAAFHQEVLAKDPQRISEPQRFEFYQ